MAQAQRDEERRAEQSANQLRRDAEERQYREQQAEAQARRDTLLIAALTSLGDFAKNQAAAAAVLATPTLRELSKAKVTLGRQPQGCISATFRV